MQLSEHFTLSEAVKSQIAARLGLDNTPDDLIVARMKMVAGHILEPVRAHFGVPFAPSSFFRSPALNAAAGGSPNSQHMRGEAVDFEVPGVPTIDLARWCAGNLEFDQLILEHYTPGVSDSGWVHCSYKAAGGRREVLTITSDGRSLQGLVA